MTPVEATLSDQATVRGIGSDLKHGEGSDGFSHVPPEHLARCMPMQKVRAVVESYKAYCHDFKNYDIRNMKVAGKAIQLNGEQYEFSPTAIANLASFGGRAIVKRHGSPDANPGYRALRAYAIRKDDVATEIFDKIANDFITHIPSKRKALIRTFNNGETRKVDAILTDRYGIIDNLWFLDTLTKRIPGGQWTRFKSDGRTVTGYYLIPDSARTELPDFGGALGIKNSEVGKASLYAIPSVFTWTCMNGQIYGKCEGEAMRRVHLGNFDSEKLDDLQEAISEHVDAQIPLFDECIQQLESLKRISIPADTMKKIIADFGDQYNLTNTEKRMWLIGVETEIGTRGDTGLTAFGVISGLTRASQKAEAHGRDMEMDAIAGHMFTPAARDSWDISRTWKRIVERANTLDDAQVEKLFAA